MKKIKYLLILVTVILVGWSLESCGDGQQKTQDSVEVAEDANDSSNLIGVHEDDAEFAVKAANGGMAEVELGKLGQEKATNTAVKDFAAMMVTDHTKANDELKTLATTKKITLPTMVGEDKQEDLTKLSQKVSKDFDKDFMDRMISDHEKTIHLFEKQAKDGKDADLKAFATKMLPSLNAHLDAAKSIKNNLK